MAPQIALAWGASTDNYAVQDYLLERCSGGACTNFALLATVLGLSYTDTDIVDGTTYRYRVRARDAAGNLSGYSPIASATATASEPIPSPSTESPDFHLQPGSSACHTGVYVAEVQFDKDGRQRPNPPSIGAYEGNCPL